ncbi:30S ribosomal protein S16 [Candidatus Falkowbacteria bacterium]|nr:30S ribosomal protein S16 [Candidatus Falkowbacteria bacterium]
MLTIRLSRIGKKNKPMYRLVISEKARDPYGRALEILGSYNPYTKDIDVKADRIKYWLSKGAQMSPSVNNILVSKSVIETEKVKSFKINTKKQLKKREEKEKAEKEAKSAEESAPAPEKAEEVPAEPAEAPAEEEKKEAPAPEKTEEKAEKEEKSA